MHYTATAIANTALAHFGDSQISSIESDQSPAGKASRALFPIAFETFVQETDWPWARKRAKLTLVAEKPSIEWGYAHRLFADCLIPRRIASGHRIDDEKSKIPFEQGVDAQGGLIYSDVAAPELVYTFLPADVSLLPPDAALALSYKQAELVAARVVREDKFEIVEKMVGLYARAVDKAKVTALLSEEPGEFPDASWRRARR